MTESNASKPCFGDLNVVFPKGEDGLPHSPETCLACPDKTRCLRVALQSRDGIEWQTERIDQAYTSGLMSFWSRWSRKKTLDRKRKHRG
uniref:4Fe-4S Wbl-type domain-containing protein n=1 Tax=Desulfatirhabdium butyrativorans TaxID=340467 RepID=A0A7C4RRP0_9BACT